MLTLQLVTLLIVTLMYSGLSSAADWKDKAEAEGKLVFYSTSNTADAKAVTDGFRRLYPNIDVQFDRTTDSQLMEKILNNRVPGSRYGTSSRPRDTMDTC